MTSYFFFVKSFRKLLVLFVLSCFKKQLVCENQQGIGNGVESDSKMWWNMSVIATLKKWRQAECGGTHIYSQLPGGRGSQISVTLL